MAAAQHSSFIDPSLNLNPLAQPRGTETGSGPNSGSEDGTEVTVCVNVPRSILVTAIRGHRRTQAIRGWPGPFTDNPPHAKSPTVHNKDRILGSIILLIRIAYLHYRPLTNTRPKKKNIPTTNTRPKKKKNIPTTNTHIN